MTNVLPIDPLLPEIVKACLEHSNLVITATPGAGKTTRVPVAISQVIDQQVWVLEPRRIAAISASARIAEENDWVLGEQVGYQVRFEQKSTESTKILFLTEALLIRKLLQDPELKSVGCVILDEFHERSIHVDLALAALKELQQLSRPDLKIIVMSATLDAQKISDFLEAAPIIQVPGRVFPTTIYYDDKSQIVRSTPELIERMHRLVLRALQQNSEGDLLCFLPGRGEIERLKSRLEIQLDSKFMVLSLHGQLTLPEQKKALWPQPQVRKIILATNIAESSLTVEGVRCVVDSGLVRVQQQDVRTGFESLVLARISKASATQRAGRAARQGPGVVYKAWTTHEDHSLAAYDIPEIFRVDLSETVLWLASLGVTDPLQLSWFESPPPRVLQMAVEFLKNLGAVDKDGRLTERGKQLQKFPLHPRLAQILVLGQIQKIPGFAAEIAALLSEKKSSSVDKSFVPENDVLSAYESWMQNPSYFANVQRVADQLKKMIHVTGKSQRPNERAVEELLLGAYSDRLCRRRRPQSGEAKMVGGRGVLLQNSSRVKESEFFLAIDLLEGRDASQAIVFQAVGVRSELIEEQILPLAQHQTRLEWDEEKQKFMTVESQIWRGLSVGHEHRRPATAEEMQDQLVEMAFQKWGQILQNNTELNHWWGRLQYLGLQKPEFPLLTEDQIYKGLELACYGEKSLADIESKNLVFHFESLLTASHQKNLQQDCPTHWTVPSGRKHLIKYTQEQGPTIEVRLQEVFGLAQSPLICGQPLTFFLLAPNFRPVQVTRDLKSFWQTSYHEVRKEMRARYPKHSWPEDPLTAPPQAKGRQR